MSSSGRNSAAASPMAVIQVQGGSSVRVKNADALPADFGSSTSVDVRVAALETMDAPPEVEIPLVNTATKPQPKAELIVDGRYRVVGQLGSGAMGVVYRAEDIMLQRPAALKMIEPAMARTPAAVDRFFSEARALARLRHDNVVQIYAFGKHEVSYFFAMELVDGDNLDDMLETHFRNGTLMPVERSLEIIAKVAAGLTAAHARNLVHRDVKPSNIMIERETGRPVLVDFGIVQSMGQGRESEGGGTPSYMAPEQVRNDLTLMSHKLDVYALACTAFEMITGRLVFLGNSVHEVMVKHVNEAPPLISSVRPELAALDPIFSRALAKNPQYRHDSCVHFAEELEKALKNASATRSSLRVVPPAVPDADAARVLVLADDDGLRRAVVREATRALGKARRTSAVECVDAAGELLAAFARQPAAIVILDDDRAGGVSIGLAAQLRTMHGGAHAEVLVLTRDMLADRGTWESVRARRVVKPFNARVLGSVLDEIAGRVHRTG